MNGLPDEYRADPDLNRYATVEDLAKGLKETRTWARGRVPIPADDAGWKEFGEKLRPESADKYNFEVPEGDSGEMATAYRQFAFDEGIPARFAERTAAFFNRQQAELVSKIATQNKADFQALDLEFGTQGYNTRIEAVNNMLRAAGIADFEALDSLANAKGAGATMRALFTLAEKTGELEKVDGAAVALRGGNMAPEAAQQEANRLMGDADFMAKAKVKGSPEAKKWDALNQAIARRGA